MTTNRTTPRPRTIHPKSVQLIKGTFGIDDARHLLLSLIAYKINFHEIKSFSDMERFGRKDRHAEKRIDQLKKSRSALLRLMKTADADRVRLRIDALVKIRVAKSAPPRRISRARSGD